jgi:hypothetical protein
MIASLNQPGLHLCNARCIVYVHAQACAEGERADAVPTMADRGEDVEEVVLVQKLADCGQGPFW